MALLMLVTATAVLLKPNVTRAFTLIEQPVFLDPIDLAPGEIARVRLTNLFGSDTLHARIEIRNAEDSALIALLDRFVPAGQGITEDVSFADVLPAVQRAGHVGIIAVVNLTPASGSEAQIDSSISLSAQLIDAATQRTLAVVADRHIAPNGRGN